MRYQIDKNNIFPKSIHALMCTSPICYFLNNVMKAQLKVLTFGEEDDTIDNCQTGELQVKW